MKRILLFVMLVMTWGGSFAGGLVPEYSTLDERSGYHVLHAINWLFKDIVSIVPDSYCLLQENGKVIAKYPLELCVYEQINESFISIVFAEPLKLPVGGKYEFVIPEGFIQSMTVNNASNDEIVEHFEVPAHLHLWMTSPEDKDAVEKLYDVHFIFPTETAKDNGATLEVYREGELFKIFDLLVTWDWNQGTAGVEYDKEMYFEKGVHYSVVLPAGAVHAKDRDDIVNEELRVDVVGSYNKPIKEKPLNCFSRISLSDNQELEKIAYYFYEPVVLTEHAAVELWKCNFHSEELLMSIKPTIEKFKNDNSSKGEEPQWVVWGDFDNYRLDKDIAYKFTLREGSVRRSDGSGGINICQSEYLDNLGGITEVAEQKCKIHFEAGTMEITGAVAGADVSVFSTDGHLLCQTHTDAGGNASLTIARRGTCIVTVGSQRYKVYMI